MFNQVFEVFGTIAVDNDPALRSFDELERQARSSVDNTNQSLRRLGEGTRATGRAVTTAFAPLAALQGVAISIAANFEQEMLTVQAISGATGDELEAMTQQARDLGASTAFSASEAAQGMTYLAMAGWDAQEVMEAMPGMLDLAAAGTLDLGRAADIASNVMSSFQYDASRATEVADLLAYTASNANTDVNDLGEAMSFAGANASGLGLSMEDTLSGIAMLAQTGVKGGRAGRNFGTMLTELSKKSEDLGLDIFDASGQIEDLDTILAEVEEQGWTTQEILGKFGAQTGRTLVALLSQGSEAAGEFSDSLENASEGMAQMVAETKMSGWLGSLEELKGALEELALAVADSGLLEASQKWMDRLTEIVRAAAKLDPRLLRLATVIVSVGAALGPVLLITGQMMIALSALNAPIAIGITLLAGLAAGIFALTGNMEALDGLLGVIDTALQQFTGRTLAELRDGFNSTADSMLSRISTLADRARTAFIDIGTSMYQGLVSGIFGRARALYDRVQAWIGTVIQKVKDVLGIASPSTVFIWIGEQMVAGFAQGFAGVLGVMENITTKIQFMLDLLVGRVEVFGRRLRKSFMSLAEIDSPISSTFRALEGAGGAGSRRLSSAFSEAAPVLRFIAQILMGDVLLALWVVKGALQAFGVDVEAWEQRFAKAIQSIAQAFQSLADRLAPYLNAAYRAVDRFVFEVENRFIILRGAAQAVLRYWERQFGSAVVGAFRYMRDQIRSTLWDISDLVYYHFGINLAAAAYRAIDSFDQVAAAVRRMYTAFTETQVGQVFVEGLNNIADAAQRVKQGVSEGMDGAVAVMKEHQNILIPVAGVIAALLLGRFTALGRLIPMVLMQGMDIIPALLKRLTGAIDNVLSGMGFRTGTYFQNINTALDNFVATARHTIDNFNFGNLRISLEYLQEYFRVTFRSLRYTFQRFTMGIETQFYKLSVPFEHFPKTFIGKFAYVMVDWLKRVSAVFAVLVTNSIPNLIRGFMRAGNGIENGFTQVLRIIGSIAQNVANIMGNVLAPFLRRVTKEGELFREVGDTIRLVLAVLATQLERTARFWSEVFAEGTLARRVLEVLGDIIGTALVGAVRLINGLLEVLVKLIEGDFIGAARAMVGVVGDLLVAAFEQLRSIVYGIIEIFGGRAVREGFENFMSATREFVENVATTLWELPGRIRDIFLNIKTALENLTDDWVEAGRNVVQGFIDGITGWVGRATEAVEGVGQSIINRFRSILGISSPSEVFAQHGRDIVDGLVNGINENSEDAVDAVDNLGRETQQAFTRYLQAMKGAADLGLIPLEDIKAQLEEIRATLVLEAQQALEAGEAGEAAFVLFYQQINQVDAALQSVNQGLERTLGTTDNYLRKLTIQAEQGLRPVQEVIDELATRQAELQSELQDMGPITTEEDLNRLFELQSKLTAVTRTLDDLTETTDGAASSTSEYGDATEDLLLSVNAITRDSSTMREAWLALQEAGLTPTAEILSILQTRFGDTAETVSDANEEVLGANATYEDLVRTVDGVIRGAETQREAWLALQEAGITPTAEIIQILNQRFRETADAADSAGNEIDDVSSSQQDLLRTIAFVTRDTSSMREAWIALQEAGLVPTAEILAILEQRFKDTGDAADDASESIDKITYSQTDLERTVQYAIRGATSQREAWIALQEAGLTPTAEILEYLAELFPEVSDDMGDTEEKVGSLKDQLEAMWEITDKAFDNSAAAKIAKFGDILEIISENTSGLASEWAAAGQEIADGIATIVEAGGDLEGVLAGVTQVFNGLNSLLPQHDSAANNLVTTYFELSGVVAELVTGIPGLGAAMSAFGGVVSSVLGDMSNGMKQVQEQIAKMQKGFKLIDVGDITKTKRVSRGGILGWLGFTKQAIDEAATNLAIAIAEKLEGIGDVLSKAMKGFLSGAIGPDGVLTQLEQGVRGAIEDAIIEAIIQGAVFKGAIGDLLTQLTNALAAGEDPSGIIAKINAALPGVRDTIVETLGPVREMLDDTFGTGDDTTGGDTTSTGTGTTGQVDPEAYRVVSVGPDGSISSNDQAALMTSAHSSLTSDASGGMIGALQGIEKNQASEGTLQKIHDTLKEQTAGIMEVNFNDKVVIREDADIERITDSIALKLRDAKKGM